MRNVTIASLIAVGVLGLLLLAVLAGRVGGIAIRNNVTQSVPVTLSVSQPIVRGVPTVVRWSLAGEGQGGIHILLRTGGEERVLSEALFVEGTSSVVFPCDSDDTGTLLLREATNRVVIAQEAVTLLPAGQECVF